MQLNDEVMDLLNSVLTEWNKAEEDIKVAEQVAHKVVNPSIKELRYAGRRVVDALVKAQTATTQKEFQDIERQLHDAVFDCHRARHDAIDAGTSKIAIDLDIMMRRLGYEVILPVHPSFPVLFRELRLVRTKIVASRKNRLNREAIYSTIESVDFPALVEKYNLLMEDEKIMKEMARKRRRSELIGTCGFIVGVLGIVLCLVTWYYPRESSSGANTASGSSKSDLLVPRK
jgi:flagellar hook-basal body complex protein FliE